MSQCIAVARGATRALIFLLLAGFAGPAFAQVVNYNLADTSVLHIKLPRSQSVTVTVSGPIGQLVVADPTIADAQPVTDRSLYVVGKALGTTTINLYSADDSMPVGLIEVEVGVDTADMAGSIRAVVPNSNVQVATVNGRVRLSGTVADAESMQKVLDVVAQYGSDGVINTITFSGKQQVNLEVRILEAQRAAGRELGINVGLSGTVGPVTINNNSAAMDVDPSFGSFLTSIIDGGIRIDILINALESKNLVRTLAEPNLTTLSGESASFLAGGQVPVRVPGPDGNIGLVYKDFGVKLVFVPVVLSDDRIQIRLSPEVSSISAFTATSDPIFTTRTLESTIELRDGQSFAVAGLMQSSNKKVQSQLPWIGDIPVLGALFRSSSYQKDETELVVIVTPRLVRPMTPGQILATPLDKTDPSNDAEFFMLGQLEVTPKLIQTYENGDGIVGPFGHIMDLDGE